MKHSARGFTIVEVLITIVVIAILAGITIVSYASLQRSVRDDKRKADITVVSQGLEKFFDENGEYPASTTAAATNPQTCSDVCHSATRLNQNTTFAQLKTIAPGIDQNFGDPSNTSAIHFRESFVSANSGHYFYTGGTSYGNVSSTNSYTLAFSLKSGPQQQCTFTFTVSSAMPAAERTRGYVIGYYSEVESRYVFYPGNKGIKYAVTTASSSAQPCELKRL